MWLVVWRGKKMGMGISSVWVGRLGSFRCLGSRGFVVDEEIQRESVFVYSLGGIVFGGALFWFCTLAPMSA